MLDELSKPCKCGHYQNVHIPENVYDRAICLLCYSYNSKAQFPRVHNFKLDNLKYIEDLAKERKLI